MDTLAHLISGFGVALSPLNLLIAAAGALIGTVVGFIISLGGVQSGHSFFAVMRWVPLQRKPSRPTPMP